MRADRLISLLLLLQRHDRVTAAQAAEELEVSVRTARRDFEALMMAGIPVYSQPGHNGGWSLVGGASTDLTGLTHDEAQSLLVAIGVTGAERDVESRQAIRKLIAALPESFQSAAENLANRTLLDEVPWAGRLIHRDRPAAFSTVMLAVAEHRVLEFTYREVPRRVRPLGAVRKSGNWYLLADADGGTRNFRLDRMSHVIATDDSFAPEADFDIAVAWEQNLAELRENANAVFASGIIHDPTAEANLRYHFQERVTITDDQFRAGALSADQLVRDLIVFGNRIEVTDPPEIRLALVDTAASIVSLYNGADDDAV